MLSDRSSNHPTQKPSEGSLTGNYVTDKRGAVSRTYIRRQDGFQGEIQQQGAAEVVAGREEFCAKVEFQNIPKKETEEA